jgi:hypothetical protein
VGKDKYGYDPDYDGESSDVDDEDLIAQLQRAHGTTGGLKPPPNKSGCLSVIVAPAAILTTIYAVVEYLAC